MSDYYILKGKEAVKISDVNKWTEGFINAESRHVERDVIGDVEVSTIFFGLDHHYGQGKPILFETMVRGGKLDQETDTYSTWNEAVNGHKKMVARVKAEIN